MWSDYGNKNKGFCIEYQINIKDKKMYNDIFYNLFPIIYFQRKNDSNTLCEINDKIDMDNLG